MKVLSLTAALLLSGTALAAPSPAMQEKMRQRREERRAAMAAGHRAGRTVPPLALNYTSLSDTIKLDHSKKVEYDSNWAGAVINSNNIEIVTAEFTVPTPKEPSGGSSNTEYGGAAWVGIDGDSCQSAILQTGVEFIVEGTETAYSGWYEWYPDYSYTFSGFQVSPGNKIKATVHATSKVAGTATLQNLSTGKSVTHTFSNMGSVGSLCLQNAEWIVEDYEENGQLVPFANFGEVVFSDASYTTSAGTYGVTGATILDVEQNNQVETNCGLSGSSTVYCKYV